MIELSACARTNPLASVTTRTRGTTRGVHACVHECMLSSHCGANPTICSIVPVMAAWCSMRATRRKHSCTVVLARDSFTPIPSSIRAPGFQWPWAHASCYDYAWDRASTHSQRGYYVTLQLRKWSEGEARCSRELARHHLSLDDDLAHARNNEPHTNAQARYLHTYLGRLRLRIAEMGKPSARHLSIFVRDPLHTHTHVHFLLRAKPCSKQRSRRWGVIPPSSQCLFCSQSLASESGARPWKTVATPSSAFSIK